MEIFADSVRVDGLHHPLLRETTLKVADGQVALVAGEPGEGHTAFALVLSGRLEPSYGDVLIDGAPNGRQLRARVAPVDVPGVSAPEPTLVLSHVVSEELVMAGVRAKRSTVQSWLDARDAAKYFDAQIGMLPPSTRIRILTDLAAARRGVRALVMTLPDRHGGRPEFWWRTACQYADQGFAVVVLCTATSARQLGIEPHHLGTPDGTRKPAATTTVVLADSSQLAIAARQGAAAPERLALGPGRAGTVAASDGGQSWADYSETGLPEDEDELAAYEAGERSAPMLPGPSLRPGVFGQPDPEPDVPDVMPEEYVAALVAERDKLAAKAARSAARLEREVAKAAGDDADRTGRKNGKNNRRGRKQGRGRNANGDSARDASATNDSPTSPEPDDLAPTTAEAGTTRTTGGA